MTTLFTLVLSGQGDINYHLIPENVLDWILRTDTPGRQGNESSWLDTATPPEVSQRPVRVTIGSYQNDRALEAAASPRTKTFHSISQMMKWAGDNHVTVSDGYEGCIY